MEEQTYFVRINLREEPFRLESGSYTYSMETIHQQYHASKDYVLRVFRNYPLSHYKWQLWDNLKQDWIDPQKFVEDNL